MQQLAQETRASRAEITRLRQELETERAAQSSQPASGADQSSPVDVRIGHLEEEQQLLTGKVDEQYQTKLESASKYRVRFSGIALFNLFSNQGTVDNIDVPTLAYQQSGRASSGSFGGTLRQSIFGFEVFGPQLFGARSSGSVNFDAGGGFPNISDGVNSGLVRLRTATMRLDWKDTDIVAGQDQLFFQPNSPTSFASLIVPALSYAGNLWAWTPQIHVEHRFALNEKSTVTLQGRHPRFSDWRASLLRVHLVSPTGGGRSLAPAGLCRACGLFLSAVRTSLHHRRRRVLQSRKLGLRPRRERIRSPRRLEPPSQPEVPIERIVLSRTGHRRAGRRYWTQRSI